MRRVFLHIGTEKTGTTSVQRHLAANREDLLRQGVLYPKSAGRESQIRLAIFAEDFKHRKDSVQAISRYGCDSIEEFRAKFRQDLLKEAAGHDWHTLILSNEHCSTRLIDDREIQRLKTLLEPISDDLHVVVYLREQAEFLASRYSTAMKAGHSGHPPLPTGKIVANFCDYSRLLERWSNVFGHERLNVRLFQEPDLEAGDIVQDFMKTCGLSALRLAALADRQNESIDIVGLEFLSIANRLLRERGGERKSRIQRALVRAIGVVARGPRLSYLPEEAAIIRERCRESNKAVADRYFGGRWPLFVESAGADGGRQFGSATKEEIVALALDLIELLSKETGRFKHRPGPK